MRTWLVWAFLIDKYVAVHLNENDPNKNTYSIHKHCRFRRTTRQFREEQKNKWNREKHLILPYQMDTKQKQIKKRAQRKLTHNTKMSLETMIVVDSCFIFWFFIHSTRISLLNFKFIKPFDFNVFVVCGFFLLKKKRIKNICHRSSVAILAFWCIFFCSFLLRHKSAAKKLWFLSFKEY